MKCIEKFVSSNKQATQWMCVCIQQLAFHFYHEFPPIARSSVNIAFEQFTHQRALSIEWLFQFLLFSTLNLETNFWTFTTLYRLQMHAIGLNFELKLWTMVFMEKLVSMGQFIPDILRKISNHSIIRRDIQNLSFKSNFTQVHNASQRNDGWN